MCGRFLSGGNLFGLQVTQGKPVLSEIFRLRSRELGRGYGPGQGPPQNCIHGQFSFLSLAGACFRLIPGEANWLPPAAALWFLVASLSEWTVFIFLSFFPTSSSPSSLHFIWYQGPSSCSLSVLIFPWRPSTYQDFQAWGAGSAFLLSCHYLTQGWEKLSDLLSPEKTLKFLFFNPKGCQTVGVLSTIPGQLGIYCLDGKKFPHPSNRPSLGFGTSGLGGREGIRVSFLALSFTSLE